MDTMDERREISEIVLDAYDLLLQKRIVEITKPLKEESKGEGWTFECIVSVSYPNQENIPSKVPLKVMIPESFPLVPVNFYSNNEEVTGFPHQDAETGKLCLPEERLAPRNAERLVHYVNWAKDWLDDAADGNLIRPGDPYELPDFSRKLLTEPLPTYCPILFNENKKSFEKWESNIGKFGVVKCFLSKIIPAIFAVQFYNKDGKIVWESEFAPTIFDQDRQLNSKWVILPDLRFKRHRPPQTYEEITKMFSDNNLNFYSILKKAWEIDNRELEIGFILIGFPIPQIYGEDPIEIHWQPLIFPNLRVERKIKRIQSKKSGKIWNALKNRGHFQFSQQLPWAKASNITHERIYARGSYSPSIQSLHIAIFGCGASGSLVAELLARGGVRSIDLFDPDSIQMSNLCRHTLDGTDLRLNKALALARRLSSACPLSNITGYKAEIPANSSSSQDVIDAVSEADLLVDCTTSESAFDWLNQYAIKNNKRMISLFFNFHADLLTLCISASVKSCGEIFQDLISCAKKEQLSLSSQEYFYQPTKEEQIIEGAGCWHPTFPALNSHINILVATALDIINSHIEQGEGKGLAIILRRNSFDVKEVKTGPIVKIEWIKQYL